jgi:hypothetical protein
LSGILVLSCTIARQTGTPSHLINFREAKLARRSGPHQTSLIDFERSEAGSLGLPHNKPAE